MARHCTLLLCGAALIVALPPPPVFAAGTAGCVVQFECDSVELTPRARAALDARGKRAADTGYWVIDVSGHADSLGTFSYNRSLSERRAEAVRDHLAQNGIDVHRVRMSGLGSLQPAADGQCAGLPRARRVACLQLDRAVEITVFQDPHAAGRRFTVRDRGSRACGRWRPRPAVAAS